MRARQGCGRPRLPYPRAVGPVAEHVAEPDAGDQGNVVGKPAGQVEYIGDGPEAQKLNDQPEDVQREDQRDLARQGTTVTVPERPVTVARVSDHDGRRGGD